jgi:hypothetical protein
MKKMLKYCFSILLFFVCFFSASAQAGRIKGVRFGYDLSRAALPYIERERKGFEFSTDFEVKLNYYATAEYGQQKVSFKKTGYDYNSDGYYFRLGFDYNYSKNNKDITQYEMVFGGIRFGYSNYSHEAANISIAENYWGTETVAVLPPVSLTAHWFEVTAGIRGELFKNFFVGWSFRGRVMLWQKKDANMYAYNIPGYGAGNKKSQLGFNYSIYYRIPLFKTKK